MAMKLGYKILQIYEIHHFDKISNELFKEYVKKFYKIKCEETGCPCKQKVCPIDCPQKLEYIRLNKALYDIDLDPDKIIKNEGLRFIAKICLNNLWGFLVRAKTLENQYTFPQQMSK
jgi:hypothetical protein